MTGTHRAVHLHARISTDEEQPHHPPPAEVTTRPEPRTRQPRRPHRRPAGRRPQGPSAAMRSSSARALTPTPIEPCPATVRAGQEEPTDALDRPRSYRDLRRPRSGFPSRLVGGACSAYGGAARCGWPTSPRRGLLHPRRLARRRHRQGLPRQVRARGPRAGHHQPAGQGHDPAPYRPLTSGRKRTPTLHRPCSVAARSFAARSLRGGSASSLLHRHTGTLDALEHTIRRPGGHPQRAKVPHRPKQVLRAHGSCWPISPVPVRTTTTEEVREAEPAAVAAWLARFNLTGEDQ